MESKLFRRGRFVNGSVQGPKMVKFKTEKGIEQIQFLSFTIESDIDIGFGQSMLEVTSIQLLGQETIQKFSTLNPNGGDEILINNAISYTNQSGAVVRVVSPEQFDVVLVGRSSLEEDKTSDNSLGKDEESDLIKTISAEDYFREFTKTKKS